QQQTCKTTNYLQYFCLKLLFHSSNNLNPQGERMCMYVCGRACALCTRVVEALMQYLNDTGCSYSIQGWQMGLGASQSHPRDPPNHLVQNVGAARIGKPSRERERVNKNRGKRVSRFGEQQGAGVPGEEGAGVERQEVTESDFTFTFHSNALEKEMATHPSVLAWRIPGTGEPGGLLSVLHPWIQPTTHRKCLGGKNFRQFPKVKLEFALLQQIFAYIREDVCRIYANHVFLHKGYEYPWILVSEEVLEPAPSRIYRDDCVDSLPLTQWRNLCKEQTLALRKEGIGVVLDSELPHLIGIYDDLLSTGMILYHLKEGQTHVGREDASTEQDIVLHGLDLESEHCIFENVGGTVTLIPLSGSQCSVNGVQIMEATHLNQGIGFWFSSGLLPSLSLSMSDLSKSRENLSAVMLYNPGKLIEEMEEKQKSDKAALERMQQEVETQRQETEMAQRQIRKQEESLKRRSSHLESTLKDLLAEKERFEEARQREQQETELQQKKQEEERFLRVQEELQRLQELNSHEKAEKVQIFQELERLKREKEEQYAKLEREKQRLEEQEQEQVLRVAQLEAQLHAKQQLLRTPQHGEAQRAAEERRHLEGIRAALLRAREAGAEGVGDGPELEQAQLRFLEFKRRQLATLANLEKDLVQQKDLLKREVEEDQEILRERLPSGSQEELRGSEKEEEGGAAVLWAAGAVERTGPAEGRLQGKKRQLEDLLQQHLPRLLEEKQRVREILDRGPLGLDNTLYLVEKEMEEKEEQLAQYQASASQLQKLQATFEFTANVARQEEKVRRKEKEILESQEQQQREALERAVARLERRHSALQRRCARAAGGEQAGQEALEKDRERLEHEIQQLKLKICEVDGVQKGHRGTLEGKPAASSFPSSAEKSHPVPLMDARISAYIEEEVQRRLQDLQRVVGDGSSEPADTVKDNEKLHNGTIQRKLKYEICRDLLCVLGSASEAAACAEHPLFREDLVQLSLDWKAEIPDLVLANGVRLSSRFQNTLVDLIYFLHCNLDAGAPSLAEAQLLLYTTVRVEGDSGQGPCQSLVLLNTHVALVKEDRVFHPRSPSLSSPPPGTRFDVIRCRALSEFRCLVIPETKTSSTLELVFLRKLRHQSDSGSGASGRPQEARKVQPCTSVLDLQGSRDVVPEVWKLTFNSRDEALWLTSHLTRL
ncbi:hypothetical protein FD755_005193, partial [Muntiacus reevesi]